ncbi:hypothetical protein E5673_08235 [Sphingomonas sp. PAMC26645]|uniref:hypothetical protein n=1 Tax=Sphingomonas sp. PAMC26645 TaxID=2565555 RepID=UPI00109E2E37|nr:hypothetical protein [Sphingomonas sp. PAMC26645]QCB42221.1 hypothetical protein E5673_08235 [Sphingomonas sp. PAMC26645]
MHGRLATTGTANDRAGISDGCLDIVVQMLTDGDAAGLCVPPFAGVDESLAGIAKALTFCAGLECGHGHLRS